MIKHTSTTDSLGITEIMSSENGRHLMWRILEQSGIFGPTFDADPYKHARNAGARDQGIWLEHVLKAVAIGDYLTMIREHTDAG